MDDLKKRLGRRLRMLRRDRQLTQEELAERAEVHATFLTKVKRGERLPSLTVLKRLADGLGVPVSVIVSSIDDNDGGSLTESVVDEILVLLKSCTDEELAFLKDLISLLRRHTFLCRANAEAGMGKSSNPWA